MKKLLATGISMALLVLGCSSGGAVTTGAQAEPTIYNYGYAKFTVSSYSNTMAVTAYNTTEGISRLTSSQYKTAYYSLSTHYAPQSNILSCGIASAVIMLNTIYANTGKTPPLSKSGSWYLPEDNVIEGNFTWTEDNFFNDNTKGYLNKEVIYGREKINGQYVVGVTLDQLTTALNKQGLTAEKVNVTTSTTGDINHFRDLLKQQLAHPTKYIIVNYNLNVMSELNGGHFSPLGAYDETSDSALILDTWSAFAPWTWVKVYDLYKSMNTKDGDAYRGYILVDANSAN
jgi:hypothetical protein